LGVLLDLGAVDGKAVALRVGEEAAKTLVADEGLIALLQLALQRGDDRGAVGGVFLHLIEVAADNVAPPGERHRLGLVIDLAPFLHQNKGNERRGIVEDEFADELVGSLAHAQNVDEPSRFVGGGENPRLDGAGSLSGWDNVRRIGVDARVACASSLSRSAYRSWRPGPLGLAWADAGRMAG